VARIMMTIEDIAGRPEPDGSAITSPEPPTRAPRLGHRPKNRAAIEALDAEGLLPPHLRPVARFRIVSDWLMAIGYAGDMPERDAVEREYQRYRREQQQRTTA
jgi:hypothetical protein